MNVAERRCVVKQCALRLGRGLTLLLLVIGLTGLGATAALAQEEGGLDGNVYTSVEYGWSVEFDDELWVASEVEQPEFVGLYLAPAEEGAFGFNNLIVYDDGITDPEECLAAAEERFSQSEVFVDFAEAGDELEPPETETEAAQLYTTTYTTDDIEIDIAYYLECRAVEDATLIVQLAVDREFYEDFLPAWEELLAAIDTGDAGDAGTDTRDRDQDEDEDTQDRGQDEDQDQDQDEDQDDDRDADQDTDTDQDADRDEDTDRDGTTETGLDGNVYTNAEYGWSVEFDEDVWTGSEVDEQGIVGVSLTAADQDVFGFANLLVRDNGITDPEECREAEAEALNPDIFVDLTPARRLDPPETARDAEGEIYTTTFTLEDSEVDLAFYIECRAVEDATLTVQVAVEEREYEDLLPDIEGLLAGIETGDGDSDPDEDQDRDQDEDQDEDQDTDRDNDADQDEDADQPAGGETYTDPNSGWSLEYDPDVWTLSEVTEPDYQGASLMPTDADVFGFVSMLVYDNGLDTAEACFDNLESNLSESGVFLDFREARDLDPPESDPDAVGGNIYTTTYTQQDDGTETDLAYYIECREVEGGILTIQMAVDAERYGDYVAKWETLLAGIDPGGNGRTLG
jgi:hypothetical protein